MRREKFAVCYNPRSLLRSRGPISWLTGARREHCLRGGLDRELILSKYEHRVWGLHRVMNIGVAQSETSTHRT